MLTRARDGHAVLDTRGAMVPCVRRHRISGAIAAGFVSATVDSPAILVPGPTRRVSWLRAVHATNHEREMKTHGEMAQCPSVVWLRADPLKYPGPSAGESVGNCSDAMRSGLRSRGRRVVVTREARGERRKRTGLDSASVERAPNAEPSPV